ncbi:MAG: hypothetical protein LBJ17_04955 [Dysgonamonadaceae bacterium]|jgi:hypothetical protein|nr:hypothetical protein [Dysgonamonadaceae bacterium]
MRFIIILYVNDYLNYGNEEQEERERVKYIVAQAKENKIGEFSEEKSV